MRELPARLLMEAGACSFGVAKAEEVGGEDWSRFEQWLEKGCHGGMQYMERHRDIRRDPRLLLEGAESIISIAFNYRQSNPLQGKIATYALGADYHRALRKRLEKTVDCLREEYGGNYRICIDSAPILERYWAVKAGVGYRSPISGCVVVPGTGSMVFLAEIITTLPPAILGENQPVAPGAPQMAEWSDARCPTGALQADATIDARRCLNYLTIEHRGDWSEEQKKTIAEMKGSFPIFGCDICQLCDPANQGTPPETIEELRYNPSLEVFLDNAAAEGERARESTGGGFRLKQSAMARAGHKGLHRNMHTRAITRGLHRREEF